MAKARRMALVPEHLLQTLAHEKQINTSPTVSSLSAMDQEMKAILDNGSLPASKKLLLYQTVANRYQDLLGQYKAKVPEVRVVPEQPPKRRRVNRYATAIGNSRSTRPIPQTPPRRRRILPATPSPEDPIPFLPYVTPPSTHVKWRPTSTGKRKKLI